MRLSLLSFQVGLVIPSSDRIDERDGASEITRALGVLIRDSISLIVDTILSCSRNALVPTENTVDKQIKELEKQREGALSRVRSGRPRL
jgi:hypothetical protein